MAEAATKRPWWSPQEAPAGSVPILVPDEHGKLTLDVPALCSVLMHPDIRRLPVVVIAAAGAFRRGKSFLLSLLLRYLNAGDRPDWLRDPDQALTAGFAWRSGRQRHTVGIHMWGNPVRVRLPSGQEVAVVLMDTQGAFDNRTTVAENANIFALSALTSSVQIYNVANNIGTDDLEHLSLFTELGRTACEAYGETPLQKLLLLVRDWQAPSEIAYGSDGGRQLLAEVLDCSAGARDELRTMRRHIEQSFSEVDCFLMPHPGKAVATSSTFTGCTRDIDPDFLTSLNELARLVLLPENLIVKRVAGRQVTCSDLVTHFTELFEVLHDGSLPEPKSLLSTMSEANHLAGVSESTALYTELMAEVCSETSPSLPDQQLEMRSHEAEETARDLFMKTKKMSEGSSDAKYIRKLMTDVQNIKHKLFEGNKLKQQLEEAKAQLACQKAYIQAQERYRLGVSRAINSNTEPLSSEALEAKCGRLQEEVLAFFDTEAPNVQQCAHSEQRAKLTHWMKEVQEETLLFNSQRGSEEAVSSEKDRMALEAARLRYRQIMEEVQQSGPVPEPCLAGGQLRAEQEARRTFQAGRGQLHSASPRVDTFLERDLREERDNSSKNNILKTVISSVIAIIPSLVQAVSRSGKCTLM